jgi:hypothetical protein
MDDTKSSSSDQIAARLGRMSARFLRQAGPRAQKLAADAKPLVEKATQYAIDHQDELKATGMRALRSRAVGPWGLAFDMAAKAAAAGAAASQASSVAKDPVSPKCAQCGAENPKNARFCNQCATPLS